MEPWTRKEVIGSCTLYLGDCMAIMSTLGKVDAVVTDPPYGIGADKGKSGQRIAFNGSRPIESRSYPDNDWDNIRPEKDVFETIRRISKHQIIWGGNYFADWLPARGRWLWWDKCQTMPSYGDGELAWTSLDATTPKKFTFANNKIFAQRAERYHPTQKPLELMAWCLTHVPQAKVVCDPFMGSGTTGVACVKAGRSFIGIEREPSYFDIACSRIQDAYSRPDMFIEAERQPEPKQEALL